jgi:hypothetical protein
MGSQTIRADLDYNLANAALHQHMQDCLALIAFTVLTTAYPFRVFVANVSPSRIRHVFQRLCFHIKQSYHRPSVSF